jgi:general secretion pathway protein B
VSFIYEALKRAEDDNQQRVTAPVRADAGGVASRARSRWWLWALIGVLGANALVIGAWTLVRGQRSPGDASPVATRVAASTPNVASAPRPPGVETPKPVPTIVPATETAPSAATAPLAPPATVEPRPQRGTLAAPAPPSRTPTVAERPTDRAAAPTASAPVNAPAITLQVLVYSETPAQRMVFIAGRRYAEGDAIDAETVLERINADGAVFRRRGQRFVISDRR